MKICVLQPDCSQSTATDRCSSFRDLSPLIPEHQVESVLLNKATVYRQLKALNKQGYDVFINLCRGYRDGDSASCQEVTASLESLNLPHTTPAATLYDMAKNVMKHIAYFAGIDTPGFVVAETLADVDIACRELNFPLFVKPAAYGDCLGIDAQSYVTTKEELLNKTAAIIADFDQALIEEYIAGREFTVLLAANPADRCSPIVYKPIEVVFPTAERFRTHASQDKGEEAIGYVPCSEAWLDFRLRDAAKRIFLEVNQGGYASVDFRVDQSGEIFFLEINAPCSVFCAVEAATAADSILQCDQAAGRAEFLSHIIAEGIHRHQRRQKKYRVQKSPIATYGIFAIQDLPQGEAIVAREAQPQRIATLSQIRSHWTMAERTAFLRYIYPVNPEVMVLRNADPSEWLVQNHSCDPNTAYQGLDLIALRDIVAGEELTVDFATFRDENRLEFDCQCGSPKCRGNIRLIPCGEPEESIGSPDLYTHSR